MKKELIRPYERPKDDSRTGIESPHVLETPSVAAATEKPRNIIRECDRVRAKAMSGEQTPDGSLAPIHHWRRHHLDVHRIRQTGNGAKARGVSWSTAGVWGDLATGSREAESSVELALVFA